MVGGQVNECLAIAGGRMNMAGVQTYRLKLEMKDTGGELGQRVNIIYFTSP